MNAFYHTIGIGLCDFVSTVINLDTVRSTWTHFLVMVTQPVMAHEWFGKLDILCLQSSIRVSRNIILRYWTEDIFDFFNSCIDT